MIMISLIYHPLQKEIAGGIEISML